MEIKDINECNRVVQEANDPTNGVYFDCLSGETVSGCVKMLRDGLAQIAKLPGSGIYEADKIAGGQPFVSEFFNDVLGKYTEGYAVAVVKSDFCYSSNGTQPEMNALKKKNACLGGFATDGGWNVAVGTLYNYGEMKPAENSTRFTEDAQSTLNFFQDVRARRALFFLSISKITFSSAASNSFSIYNFNRSVHQGIILPPLDSQAAKSIICADSVKTVHVLQVKRIGEVMLGTVRLFLTSSFWSILLCKAIRGLDPCQQHPFNHQHHQCLLHPLLMQLPAIR